MLRNLLASLVLFLFASFAAQAQTSHDRAFWRQIAQSRYAVPTGQTPFPLAQELVGLFSSPDPELRDDLAYSILYSWIRRPELFTQSELITLTTECQANLQHGLGEQGTNSVLQRSFSALGLSLLAQRDTKAQFLSDAQFHSLVAAAVSYLTAEQDLRGYEAKLGWIHATAHTADLLAELAANPRLTRDEQSRILSAIAERLQTAPQAYIQGEQSRLALAVLSIMRRQDFDPTAFNSWLDGLQSADRTVWTVKPLTPLALAHFQNRTYMLDAVVGRMPLEPIPPTLNQPRDRILEMLRDR
jgi:hypothetical protein